MNTVLVEPELSLAEPGQKKEGKNRILFLLKGAASVGLMWWILQGTNFSEIGVSIRSASLPLLCLAFGLPFLGYFISVSRWRLLLKAQGISAQVGHLVLAFMVSVFFNNFLPSTIGGDAFRIYESWRLGASKASAVAVVFVDRFLGLLALIVLTMIGLLSTNPISETIPYLSLWVVTGFVLVVALGFVLFHSSFALGFDQWDSQSKLVTQMWGIVHKINDGFAAFRGRTDTVLQAFGLSLLLQANVVVQYFIIAEALHFSIPFWSFFLIIPLTLFVMLLPISINGIGLRESIFVLILAPWGVEKPEALALAWLAYGCLVGQGLLGGAVYAFRK